MGVHAGYQLVTCLTESNVEGRWYYAARVIYQTHARVFGGNLADKLSCAVVTYPIYADDLKRAGVILC
jgi:hypothetical protein